MMLPRMQPLISRRTDLQNEKAAAERTRMAHAIWYVRKVKWASCRATEGTCRDDVVVRTLFSAISRGTERLIYPGPFLRTNGTHASAPSPANFLPVKQLLRAGVAETGPSELVGQQFRVAPHQDLFTAPVCGRSASGRSAAMRATPAPTRGGAQCCLGRRMRPGRSDRSGRWWRRGNARRIPVRPNAGADVTLVDIEPDAGRSLSSSVFVSPPTRQRKPMSFHTCATPQGSPPPSARPGGTSSAQLVREGSIPVPLGGAFIAGG